MKVKNLFDNLDEEEALAPRLIPPEPSFIISREEAISFLDNHISIYSQFHPIRKGHPSFLKLKRTAAIYNYIKENLK